MLQLYSRSADATPASCAGPPFTCRSSTDFTATWVQAYGELNLAAAPLLVRALLSAQRPPRLVVLDLRGLTSLDPAGVHAIVGASALARRDGRQLLLVPAPDHLHRAFALSGACADIAMLNLDADEQPARMFAPPVRRSVSVLAL